MIVICGIPSEAPIAMVMAALDELNLAYVVLHQRQFTESRIDLNIVGAVVGGHLTINGRSLACADVSGIYTRMLDWRALPEVIAADVKTQRLCELWHSALTDLIELAPGCVMNRAAAVATNQSKPYQAQLIMRAGFMVPETLITNDPELVRAFQSTHGEIVYKSISGVRSIVRLLDTNAVERLALVRWCPVQFQRLIVGTNIRVHVVSGSLFATRVETDRVDYRYAHRDGGNTILYPINLSDDLSGKCIELVSRLGLELAGIDLLLTAEGEVYCFEVNPNPGFSFFEANTGQPIAHAIAQSLARESA